MLILLLVRLKLARLPLWLARKIDGQRSNFPISAQLPNQVIHRLTASSA